MSTRSNTLDNAIVAAENHRAEQQNAEFQSGMAAAEANPAMEPEMDLQFVIELAKRREQEYGINMSPRNRGVLVKKSLIALEESLDESKLFHHEMRGWRGSEELQDASRLTDGLYDRSQTLRFGIEGVYALEMADHPAVAEILQRIAVKSLPYGPSMSQENADLMKQRRIADPGNFHLSVYLASHPLDQKDESLQFQAGRDYEAQLRADCKNTAEYCNAREDVPVVIRKKTTLLQKVGIKPATESETFLSPNRHPNYSLAEAMKEGYATIVSPFDRGRIYQRGMFYLEIMRNPKSGNPRWLKTSVDAMALANDLKTDEFSEALATVVSHNPDLAPEARAIQEQYLS